MRKGTLSSFSFGFIWIVAAILGATALTSYANQAGDRGETLDRWPRQTAIKKSKSQATLLVFFHPSCACSRASIRELDKILARSEQNVETVTVFIKPKDWSIDRLKGDLWKSAEAIPGVRMFADISGDEAKRFGAETSGHAMLYGQGGALLFSGGITSSRGHEGDNVGSYSIEKLLKKESPLQAKTDIFGCGLFDREKTPGVLVGILPQDLF